MVGRSGILEQLTMRVVERALRAELSHHLGHEKHGTVSNSEGNTRNARGRHTLKGQHGNLEIDVLRDRQGSFEPQLLRHSPGGQSQAGKIGNLVTQNSGHHPLTAHPIKPIENTGRHVAGGEDVFTGMLTSVSGIDSPPHSIDSRHQVNS